MIPGLGGMNPKKMQAMMKQLGLKQEEVEGVQRVVIEKDDGSRIIIDNANVQRIEMSGNVSWQVVGDVSESSVEEGISEDDVKLVMEKTGKNEDEVRKVLEEVDGDIAEAIVRLS